MRIAELAEVVVLAAALLLPVKKYPRLKTWCGYVASVGLITLGIVGR